MVVPPPPAHDEAPAAHDEAPAAHEAAPAHKEYCTWREILRYNPAMLATDYPVLQWDETSDMMAAIAASRLYFAAASFDDAAISTTHASFPALRRTVVRAYYEEERKALHRFLESTLEATPDLLCGYNVGAYLQQIDAFDCMFPCSSKGKDDTTISLRQLLDHVRTRCCVRPRRMIDLEGMPICAAPRLQNGGEWYGELSESRDPNEAARASLPNFVGRLQNCRYLIDIGGVRRFISFEDGAHDSSRDDLYGQVVGRVSPHFVTVQGFINQEQLAWNAACALWRFQEERLGRENVASLLQHRPTQTQLQLWLTKRTALFRFTSLLTKYLGTGSDASTSDWNLQSDKGHLFARNYDDQVQVRRSATRTSALVCTDPKPTQFRNIPIMDFTAPSRDQVHAILAHSALVTQPAGRVFMHCAGGWGRTGMGLLLLVMTLHDVDWPDAMKIMYRRYKRQSIAEVTHLLRTSLSHLNRIAEVQAVIDAHAEDPDDECLQTLVQKGLILADPHGTLKDVRDVKFRTPDSTPQTVTYHARVIPRFRAYIDDFMRERDPAEVRRAASLAIQFGRPLAAQICTVTLPSSTLSTRNRTDHNVEYYEMDHVINTMQDAYVTWKRSNHRRAPNSRATQRRRISKRRPRLGPRPRGSRRRAPNRPLLASA